MSQTAIQDYPTGGTSNANQRDVSGHQAPLSTATAEGAAVEVPEHVGEYERVTPRHAGEVVAWSDGADTVSVVRIICDGEPYEVTGADSSRPNPGRSIAAAPDRTAAINRAREHMRGGGDPSTTDQTL